MTSGTGMKKLLIAVVVFLCIANLKGDLRVIYPSSNISVEEMRSLVLNCTVKYKSNNHTNIPEVLWCKIEIINQCIKLQDHPKHLIMVSEMDDTEENTKRRLVSVQINNLTVSDSGTYQCNAKTPDLKTAMGHFITLTVQSKLE
ncbi:B- and T-lymphocyte attenuator-like [Acipenser oxyrinchus oxyrinchus]|uniref:B- and T-lymphocyte attenuator-like n=1 Tax=Acipenser oxyrinchus oxyrinchus TaxID=40147 RepID=A0AAD8G7S2_ACIOX|nr:B- and T-lymphocyte attenuator-like [Acipenser oxyrinchus oxyrinchus]